MNFGLYIWLGEPFFRYLLHISIQIPCFYGWVLGKQTKREIPIIFTHMSNAAVSDLSAPLLLLRAAVVV